jgi:carbon monoxide dehydrogenase subunit G
MAMEFSGEYRVPASQQKVWEALNDPAVLQACIAGCKQLEKISEHEFLATVVAKVGPISATFRGQLDLTELNPPNSYCLTGHGQGGAAGFAKMRATVNLRPDDDATVLAYTASADIGGKLASVGSRLVQTVAKKNADDFFMALTRQLGGGQVAEQLQNIPVGSPVSAPEVRTAALPIAPGGSTLAALVPAWLVVFVAALSFALGYCVALLR